jgi:hypothetical protein
MWPCRDNCLESSRIRNSLSTNDEDQWVLFWEYRRGGACGRESWQSLGFNELRCIYSSHDKKICLLGIAALGWMSSWRSFSYSEVLGSKLGLETGLMVLCCPHSLHTHEIHEVTPRALHPVSYSTSSDSGVGNCKAWWWLADRSRNMLPPQIL